jgi:acetyl-CoA C-acetyltransferase
MTGRPVYIVDGSRTPFIRARGRPGPFTPVDLTVACGKPLLLRQPFAPDAFDEVILGCVVVLADEANPARIAALRLGMGEAMTAFTVQINCGSGMLSIDTAYQHIREGESDLVLAGGVDALSWSPLIFRKRAVDWYANLFAARDLASRLSALAGFRPSFFKPVIGLERGLTDPIVELNMGQTAEVLAHVFHISRRDADEYAAESQQRLARAQKEGCFAGELEPAFSRDGRTYDYDDGVRPDSTVETLAKLKPAFERPWGKVTAGNSSQITDGAAAVLIMSEEKANELGLRPRARFHTFALAGVDPVMMLTGPIPATTKVLERANMKIDDLDIIEINEAFAPVVLSWEKEHHPDMSKVNPNGGAIALGHPLGASGARLMATLLNELERTGGRYGLQTMCEGGGMANATIIERLG